MFSWYKKWKFSRFKRRFHVSAREFQSVQHTLDSEITSHEVVELGNGTKYSVCRMKMNRPIPPVYR